jgi:MoxR-like ATPase
MNAAFLDRSRVFLEVGYLPKQKEISLVSKKTGLNKQTAERLVSFAGLTRQTANDCAGLSPRRVFAWAELVADGFKSERAFHVSVTAAADPGHVEIYKTLEMSELKHEEIDALGRGDAIPEAAPQYGNSAQDDFSPVSEGDFS